MTPMRLRTRCAECNAEIEIETTSERLAVVLTAVWALRVTLCNARNLGTQPVHRIEIAFLLDHSPS